MNNKGFGLPEVLVFIGTSLFLLIVIAVYVNNNIIFDNTIRPCNSSSSKNTNASLVPNGVDVPNEYIKLENKLLAAAKKYKFNKNENIIISLKQLKKVDLIKKLKDPNDKNISCGGYVIYMSDEKKYTSYINCPGMYVTKSYNSDFE